MTADKKKKKLVPEDLGLLRMEAQEGTNGKQENLTRSVMDKNSWLKERQLCEVTEQKIWKEGIRAAVTVPQSLQKGELWPALLYVSEAGKCNTAGFDIEAQVIASAGILVVRCDIPVEVKWLEACGKAEQCFDELMKIMNEIVRKYPVDSEKLAVAGEAAPYIISHTKRFCAAISLRALWNPATGYGTSRWDLHLDRNISFCETLKYWLQHSLVDRIDDIDTPVLVLHGEKDDVVDLEQGEQLFHAMQDRRPDIPSRLVVFPGEGHDIQETGEVKWRVRHLEEIIEWMTRFFEKKKNEEEEEDMENE
ncbi:MAG: alpha/beta hydrolase family protein [Anaerovoracaceae bacterium]